MLHRISIYILEAFYNIHSFCEYGTHLISIIKCDVGTIICDIGTI